MHSFRLNGLAFHLQCAHVQDGRPFDLTMGTLRLQADHMPSLT